MYVCVCIYVFVFVYAQSSIPVHFKSPRTDSRGRPATPKRPKVPTKRTCAPCTCPPNRWMAKFQLKHLEGPSTQRERYRIAMIAVEANLIPSCFGVIGLSASGSSCGPPCFVVTSRLRGRNVRRPLGDRYGIFPDMSYGFKTPVPSQVKLQWGSYMFRIRSVNPRLISCVHHASLPG